MTAEPRRYRVREILGQGGFGVVYRAEMMGAEGFSKEVALKVLRKRDDLPAEFIARLRDEARILGLIRHRAVVKVDGLVNLEDGWAVAMEYVEGVNVNVLVRQARPPASASIEIAEEVASALHSAFTQVSMGSGEPLKLVHRDIKPPNLRVTPQGEVKVLDFGVARADFENREAHTSHLHFGTSRYMSPERHDHIEGPECDVYALGLVLAELLVGDGFGDPPTHATRHAEFVETTRSRVRGALANLPDGPADRLAALVGSTLAYDTHDRPTAQALVAALKSLRSEIPGPRLRDWAEDHVPALVEARRGTAVRTEHTIVLVEQPSTVSTTPRRPADEATVGMELPAPPPESGATGATGTVGRIALVALVGTPMLFGIALFLVVGGAAAALWYVAEPPIDATAAAAVDPVPLPVPVPVPETAPVPEPAPEATPAPEPVPEPVAEPVPEPIPEPVKASATETAKAPKPIKVAPEVAIAPASSGTWRAIGDARAVQLRSSAGTFEVGAVPEGFYEILAAFDDGALAPAGTVTVAAGSTVEIKCTAAFMTCSARR